MRMRSALTASVLAAGVLLGGAGAALANDGGGFVRGTGAHAAERTSSSTFAGVIKHVGPVYTSTRESERDWEHGTFLGIFGRH
ncbi:hypothetical protein ACFVT5_28750 [Streptomyces sp. NPDC058001]|uniref:hypothetical protein n=1 Tax=Streptomyces sp. NPDC058001 TaxID=3346300 RepID=UPI0036F0DCB5